MDDDITQAERAKRGSPFLNTAQAAHYLGVSKRFLEELRRLDAGGPKARRHAAMWVYHIGDLKRWSDARSNGGRS